MISKHGKKQQSVNGTKREINGCPEPLEVITLNDIQDAVRASKYAYDDGVAVGQVIPGTNFKVTIVKEDTLFTDGTGFRVLVAEEGLTTMVIYRGTDSNKQLMRQALTYLKDIDGTEWKILGKQVNVFPIFLNSVRLLLPAIKYKLNDPSRKYILTGHSLGGAMASILALQMVEDGNNIWENKQSSLITFGQPRVGNRAFAELHDERIHTYRKLRFVAEKDPVPHIPFWPGYVHHSREIFLDESGWWRKKRYWQVCSLQEELFCSNKYSLFPVIGDHELTVYFRYIINPPDYFKPRGWFQPKLGSFQESILRSCNSGEKKKRSRLEKHVENYIIRWQGSSNKKGGKRNKLHN